MANIKGVFLPGANKESTKNNTSHTAEGDTSMRDGDGEEDQSGTVICKKHKVPLNFWSNKEQIYQCIKCLINEEEVHFIDNSYKKTLEEFRSIKNYAKYALNENAPMAYLIHEWKDDIRDMLQRVNAQFI